MSGSYLFVLASYVTLAEVEMSLHLAIFAVEGLAGRVRVRLDAAYQVDATNHAIRIDGRCRVGRLIARVFAALLLREFGEDAFQVRQLKTRRQRPTTAPQTEEVHA